MEDMNERNSGIMDVEQDLIGSIVLIRNDPIIYLQFGTNQNIFHLNVESAIMLESITSSGEGCKWKEQRQSVDSQVSSIIHDSCSLYNIEEGIMISSHQCNLCDCTTYAIHSIVLWNEFYWQAVSLQRLWFVYVVSKNERLVKAIHFGLQMRWTSVAHLFMHQWIM